MTDVMAKAKDRLKRVRRTKVPLVIFICFSAVNYGAGGEIEAVL